MSALRSFFASIGLTLAGLGLVYVIAPGAAGVLSLPRVGVLALGLFAVVQAARSLRTRRRAGIDGAEPPEPEPREEAGWPGDEFDQRIAVLSRRRGRGWAGGEHERLRRRLRAAAVEAAAHRWRLPTPEARERVEAGEWTEDPAAAWFLGGQGVERPPLSVRARAYLDGRTPFGFYANRTADAVVGLREGA
ncbi:MAG: hypothetical protein U5J98_06785 [Halobacteriales archaeon]|nr:hypothetical protein [Halobacteriales archaeon]